jgi:glycosyltransferase involved in cell wall biosynthesis
VAVRGPRKSGGISVVIPCYNGERHLAETLERVQAQERPALEIILVDDGSTDGSAEIARSAGVRLVSNPVNLGLPASRNRGFEASSGEFIALCDADDLWAPEHLSTVAPLLEEHPGAGLAYGRVVLFGDLEWEQEQDLPPGTPTFAYWRQFYRNLIIPSSSIIRATAWAEVGGFDPELRYVGEDWEFFLRLSARFTLVASDRITVRYRKHGGSITAAGKDSLRGAEFEVRSRYVDRARSGGDPHFVARLEEAHREAWESRLEDAWHERDLRHLNFLLSLSHLVPGSAEIRRRWMLRRLLVPVARTRDRIRARLR